MKALTETRLQDALLRFRAADRAEDVAGDRAWAARMLRRPRLDDGTVRDYERAARRAILRCRRTWKVYKGLRDRMGGRR